MVLFFSIVFLRCRETNQQVLQGAWSYGCGCSAGCEDTFAGHEVEASALSGHAGWCEHTCDDSVHGFENSVVAGVAASNMRELDVAVAAAARHGENNCNGHLLEFRNSLLAAESGYSLHCLNSLNSLICHPSMHAPSLASEMFVESVGVVGVGRFGEGDTGVARWLGTARVDGRCTLEFNLFLHALIHEFEGTLSVMVLHAVSWAPLLIRVWCVGLDFVEEQRGRYGRVLGKSLLLLSNCQAGCM